MEPIYLAPNGDDSWSGLLPLPNDDLTDGPLATFEHARDVARARRLVVGM